MHSHSVCFKSSMFKLLPGMASLSGLRGILGVVQSPSMCLSIGKSARVEALLKKLGCRPHCQPRQQKMTDGMNNSISTPPTLLKGTMQGDTAGKILSCYMLCSHTQVASKNQALWTLASGESILAVPDSREPGQGCTHVGLSM